MKLIKKDKKGFTLVELIVVIAILAILALILIPAITGYVSKANTSKNEANARGLFSQASFELYTWDDAAAPTEATLAAKLGTLDGTDVKVANGIVTVELDDEKNLVSVTFTPDSGGVATTFDGTTFTP